MSWLNRLLLVAFSLSLPASLWAGSYTLRMYPQLSGQGAIVRIDAMNADASELLVEVDSFLFPEPRQALWTQPDELRAFFGEGQVVGLNTESSLAWGMDGEGLVSWENFQRTAGTGSQPDRVYCVGVKSFAGGARLRSDGRWEATRFQFPDQGDLGWYNSRSATYELTIPDEALESRVVDVSLKGEPLLVAVLRAPVGGADAIWMPEVVPEGAGAVPMELAPPADILLSEPVFWMDRMGDLVVGMYATPGVIEPERRPFVWLNGDPTPNALPDLPGSVGSIVTSISKEGLLIAGAAKLIPSTVPWGCQTDEAVEPVVWTSVSEPPVRLRELVPVEDQHRLLDCWIGPAQVNGSGECLVARYRNCVTGEQGILRLERELPAGNLRLLRDLPGGDSTPRIWWVSDDGSVVAGEGGVTGGYVPAVWMAPDYEPMALNDLPSSDANGDWDGRFAWDGTPDGMWIIGDAKSGPDYFEHYFFRFNTFTHQIDRPSTASNDTVRTISDDGRFALGQSGALIDVFENLVVRELRVEESGTVWTGMSGDASIRAGFRISPPEALFTHTDAGGINFLPVPDGYEAREILTLSRDGSTAAGYMENSGFGAYLNLPGVWHNGVLYTPETDPSQYTSIFSLSEDGRVACVNQYEPETALLQFFVFVDFADTLSLNDFLSARDGASLGNWRVEQAAVSDSGSVFAGRVVRPDEPMGAVRAYLYLPAQVQPAPRRVAGTLSIDGIPLNTEDSGTFTVHALANTPDGLVELASTGELRKVGAARDWFFLKWTDAQADLANGTVISLEVRRNGIPLRLLTAPEIAPLAAGERRFVVMEAAEDFWNSDPSGDVDGDGFSNIVEFFCGSSLLDASDHGGIQHLNTTEDGVLVKFTRANQASTVPFAIDQSSDLEQWTELPASELQFLESTTVPDAQDVFLSVPMISGETRFFRLRVGE